jgi:hypothetical protein
MGLATGGGGTALIVALGVALAACSQGDTHSDGECARGARCGLANNAPQAGGGTNDDGAGSGAAGTFGNTDAMPPNLVGIDAGGPGVGETTEPDNPMCGGLEVEPEIMTEVIPGNILLIFDKSGSMCQTWGTSANQKWADAYQAIPSALDQLKDNLTVGAIFFPDTPSAPDGTNDSQSCFVPAFNAAPQIEFTDGTSFLAAWGAYWSAAVANPMICNDNEPNEVDGATPLLSALQAADAALMGGGLANTTHVVIITDGQPNCSGGDSNTDEPLANLTPIIANWLTAGYKTHVVGLPGVQDAIPLLDGLAMAGGTTQHIPANDPLTLQTQLAMIIGESVTTGFMSCSIGLPMVPPDPNKVVVVVNEGGVDQSVAKDLGTGGGWTLAPDNSQITLHGPLCELAQMGQYEKISVVFGCVDLPPLPPPKPPE